MPVSADLDPITGMGFIVKFSRNCWNEQDCTPQTPPFYPWTFPTWDFGDPTGGKIDEDVLWDHDLIINTPYRLEIDITDTSHIVKVSGNGETKTVLHEGVTNPPTVNYQDVM